MLTRLGERRDWKWKSSPALAICSSQRRLASWASWRSWGSELSWSGSLPALCNWEWTQTHYYNVRMMLLTVFLTNSIVPIYKNGNFFKRHAYNLPGWGQPEGALRRHTQLQLETDRTPYLDAAGFLSLEGKGHGGHEAERKAMLKKEVKHKQYKKVRRIDERSTKLSE